MSKQKNKNKNADRGAKTPSWHEHLRPETKHSLWAIFAFAAGVVLTLAHFGQAGIAGNALNGGITLIFGRGFFLVPAAIFLISASFFISSARHFVAAALIGGALFLISSLGILDILMGRYTGGYAGFVISFPLLKFFDFWASLVLLGALWISSLLIIGNVSLKPRRFSQEEAGGTDQPAPVAADISMPQALAPTPMKTTGLPSALEKEGEKEEQEAEGVQSEMGMFSTLFHKKSARALKSFQEKSLRYDAPPLDFLEDTRGIPSSGDIKANANIIKRTLANFGIDVEMGEVSVGPSVTRYTLKPAEGIKLSRITALQNDLALALAAHPLRIEAPIPGKSLVGIEVPNRSIALVGLRSILEMEEFKTSSSLTFSLGRDVAGSAVFADLARMPHLLIAGSTGSGKSIAIHTFIMSLLYKNSPQFLRFLMIDPKRVELTVYNKIPHLLAPAFIEAKKAAMSLRWAVREMERRYEKISEWGVRDISSFNAKMMQEKKFEEILPNIIIVIDELADLMAAYPREIESSIVRLAQMSRAVGIHLVVSTQRPSVEVITGLIKANITARIALQVASGVDSRTILDMSGAEKLLGNGDMLYLAGDTSKPRRIQGVFVSEKEIKRVVEYLEKQSGVFEAAPLQLDAVSFSSQNESGSLGEGSDEVDDELYEEAKDLVIETQKASASYLQRRLRVGYARAARLLDILEERGVIGPGEGAKPRDVLIKKDVERTHTMSLPDENTQKDLNAIKSIREGVPYTDFDD